MTEMPSAALPFIEDAATRLNAYLQTNENITVKKITRLVGDASTRQYFRLTVVSCKVDQQRNIIDNPVNNIANCAIGNSAETNCAVNAINNNAINNVNSVIAAVYPEKFVVATQPFCTLTTLLQAAKLPVPQIFAIDGDYGVILQRDYGDTRLQDWLATATPAQTLAAYQEAVGLIIGFQQATAQAVATNSIAAQLAFDYAKLFAELDFFSHHYVRGYLNLVPTAAATAALVQEFDQIARELAERPRTLCHRDFHSRNLMWWQGQQYVIDYQDARLGPYSYDLASLLRDPYVRLEESLVAQLYGEFWQQSNVATLQSAAEFAAEFELMTVQRLVKAIGTYAYQATVRQNSTYVPYLAPAATSVIQAAARLARFPVLSALLSNHQL
jgi:aminoglycoside/choline kinase family phosphotransferase